MTNALFKNDLYIQGLQSIIKTQAGMIEELKKDKEHYRKLYEIAMRVEKEDTPYVPIDTTPNNDTEYWKPLRSLPELPSQRRERLTEQSKERLRQMRKEVNKEVS